MDKNEGRVEGKAHGTAASVLVGDLQGCKSVEGVVGAEVRRFIMRLPEGYREAAWETWEERSSIVELEGVERWKSDILALQRLRVRYEEFCQPEGRPRSGGGGSRR